MKHTLLSVVIFTFIAASCNQKEKPASHQHENGCEHSHAPADSLKPNQESFEVEPDSATKEHCDENHKHSHKH